MAKDLLTERYKTCGDQWDAIAAALRAEFAAGQEAMREAAAQVADAWTEDDEGLEAFASHGIAGDIRSLPLTPEKES